jgi:hypothetical protein
MLLKYWSASGTFAAMRAQSNCLLEKRGCWDNCVDEAEDSLCSRSWPRPRAWRLCSQRVLLNDPRIGLFPYPRLTRYNVLPVDDIEGLVGTQTEVKRGDVRSIATTIAVVDSPLGRTAAP